MSRIALLLLLLVLGALAFLHGAPSSADPGEHVKVPKDRILFDDGDSIAIRWPEGTEVVRILGIDTPEIQHLEHDLPYPQAFGEKAAGFLEGCLAVADEVVLLRSGEKDPYGRTLGYLLLDGKNYSVLVVRARLAVENVGHYGDNGLPAQATAVKAASKSAGPVPFEPPHQYRRRMREVTAWMKKHGTYPRAGKDEDEEGR